MRKLIVLTVACIALAASGSIAFALQQPAANRASHGQRLALAGARGDAAVMLPAELPAPAHFEGVPA